MDNLNNDCHLISNKYQLEQRQNKKSLSSSALISRSTHSPHPPPNNNKKSSINDLSSMTTTSVIARISRKRSAGELKNNLIQNETENIFLKEFEGERKKKKNNGGAEKMKEDVGDVEGDGGTLEKIEILIKTPEGVNKIF
uniref:Uncharacterized protein n=1 Tax=Meloidogyne incognita TaxID=6306 RepID=A0A914NND2_MELIC